MQSIVSVIIPVYNCASELKRSIGSIIQQTMTEWTAICIDDGSTDGSGKLLDEYAALDSRIIVIHKENGGAASARNRGLEVAQTEYIVMLDADDEWDRESLARMCEAMRNSSCDLVTTGIKYLRADGEAFYRSFPSSGCIDNTPHFFARYTNKGPVPFLFKKSIIDKYKIRFPEEVHTGEDFLFIYSYGICAKRIYCIQDCLYTYTYQTRMESLSTSFLKGLNSFDVYRTYVEQPLSVCQFLYSLNLDSKTISQYRYELCRDFWSRYHSSIKCIGEKMKRKALKKSLRDTIKEIYSTLSIKERMTLFLFRYPCFFRGWQRFNSMMPSFGRIIKGMANKFNMVSIDGLPRSKK